METFYHGFNRLHAESNNEQGNRFLLLLKICLAASVLQVLLAFWLYMSARNSAIFNPHREVLYFGFNSIFALFEITAIILFFVWIYRAYSNLHTTGIRNLNYDRVWSIVAWFVPFLNFYRPYMILKELWYWNQTAFRDQAIAPKQHSFLRFWWLSLFIPIPLAMIFGLIIGPGTNSPVTFFAMGIFSSICHTLSVYLLFRFMSDLRVFEEEFYQRFAIHQKNNLTALAEKFKTTPAENVPEGFSEAAITLPEKDEILAGEVIETSVTTGPLLVCLIILTCAFGVLGLGFTFPGTVITVVLWAVIILLLPVALLFIYWLNRSYRNLRNLRIDSLNIGRNMQMLWWIIPVVNLIVPYIMLRDIKKHMQSWPSDEDENSDQLPLLDWTWLALVLGILFSWIGTRLSGVSNSESDEFLLGLLRFGGWLCLLLAFAGSVYCLKKFRKWEEQLFERVMKATLAQNPDKYFVEKA